MRRLLLSILSASTLAMSPVAAQTWTANLKPFAETNTQMSTPMAVTADGSSYVCGDYDAEMIVGDYLLSPIANSAYIIKYTAAGSVAWALSLDGSVTINSTATDAEGNLYVAGKLADKVVLNSIDNNSRTIEGAKADDGSYTVEQLAAFIAKYSPEGNLLVSNTLDLKKMEAIKDAEASEMAISMMSSGNITIATGNDKIYASILWKGSLVINGQTFDSPTYSAFGFYMMESAKAGIFSFSAADLSLAEVTATIANTEDFVMMANEPNSVCTTVDNGKVFVAASVRGSNTVTVKETTTTVGTSVMEDAPHSDNFIVIRIDEATGAMDQMNAFTQEDNDASTNENVVTTMQVKNGDLYLAGTCYGNKLFTSTLSAVGNGDLFVARIDGLGNLSCRNLWLSNYNETEAYNANTTETCNGMTFVGDNVYAYGYLYDASYKAEKLIGGIGLTGSLEGWSSGYTNDDIVTAYGINGKYSTIVKHAEGEALAVSGYDKATAIEQTSGDGCIRFVNNTLTAGTPADMSVYSANGNLMKAVRNATEVSLDDLPNGLYIVRTAQGSTKVIKK